MSQEDILEHRTRKVLYNYITTHPGESFVTIRTVLDLTEGTLRYHLQYLERHEKIWSVTKGKYRYFYSQETPAAEFRPFLDFDPKALTEVQQHILAIIQKNPGITTRELESMTGLQMRALQHNIKRLKDQMVIWKMGGGNNTGYECITRDNLKNELMRLLITKYLKGQVDEETYERLKKGLATDNSDK